MRPTADAPACSASLDEMRRAPWAADVLIGDDLAAQGFAADGVVAAVDMARQGEANPYGVPGRRWVAEEGKPVPIGCGQHGGLGPDETRPFLMVNDGRIVGDAAAGDQPRRHRADHRALPRPAARGLRRLAAAREGTAMNASAPKGLLMATMEPPATLEEEFQDWYDTEHFPERQNFPGFETAARWVCVDGWPRWLATYDLASMDAVQTPEYLSSNGDRASPWSKRILSRLLDVAVSWRRKSCREMSFACRWRK